MKQVTHFKQWHSAIVLHIGLHTALHQEFRVRNESCNQILRILTEYY